MPKETDAGRLKTLRAIFASRASDEPRFTETAKYGGYRRDEGIQTLLRGEDTIFRKIARLKNWIVEFLDDGGTPNRTIEKGDAEMKLDPGIRYEFRLEVEGVPLYVKTIFYDDDPKDPRIAVISVKRGERR
jgi:hypothetical protein